MVFKIPEIISMAVTGILGLLWWDIRGIRKERDDNQKQREVDINNTQNTFMKRADHVVLCENAALKLEQILDNKLRVAVDEIKREIRNNGRSAT